MTDSLAGRLPPELWLMVFEEWMRVCTFADLLRVWRGRGPPVDMFREWLEKQPVEVPLAAFEGTADQLMFVRDHVDGEWQRTILSHAVDGERPFMPGRLVTVETVLQELHSSVTCEVDGRTTRWYLTRESGRFPALSCDEADCVACDGWEWCTTVAPVAYLVVKDTMGDEFWGGLISPLSAERLQWFVQRVVPLLTRSARSDFDWDPVIGWQRLWDALLKKEISPVQVGDEGGSEGLLSTLPQGWFPLTVFLGRSSGWGGVTDAVGTVSSGGRPWLLCEKVEWDDRGE